MPRVSVVIPAYNAERFIGQAIETALSQLLSPDEIIVVDDGSTDNSREVVNSFGGRIQYRYQENAGSGRARNVGIFTASSEVIAFLDSDDYWDPEHLVTMVKILNSHPKACLVYCGKKWVNEDGNLLSSTTVQERFPDGWIFRDMFEANYISSSSVVVARKDDLLEVGGFDEARELRNAQDYQLWLRMTAMYAVASSPQKTVNYRRHDSNRTRDEISRQRGLLYALESASTLIEEGLVNQRNEPARINVSARMKQQYESAVVSLYYSRQYHAAREFCLQAIKKGYWSTPLLLRFFFTIIPSPLRSIIHSLRKSDS